MRGAEMLGLFELALDHVDRQDFCGPGDSSP